MLVKEVYKYLQPNHFISIALPKRVNLNLYSSQELVLAFLSEESPVAETTFSSEPVKPAESNNSRALKEPVK